MIKYTLSIVFLCFIMLSGVAQNDRASLHFDGQDDFVILDEVADTLSKLQNFTIEFWMIGDKDSQ
ncbi:MAG: hypothetical protein JXR19_09430 [Bacteroidia bacterium]